MSGARGRVDDNLGVLGDLVPVVLFLHGPAPVRTQGAAVVVVGEERADAVGEVGRVRIPEKAVDVVPDELPRAAAEGGNHSVPGRSPGTCVTTPSPTGSRT